MSNLSSNYLRKQVLRMAKAGNSVHIACAFSIVEIISTLYSDFLNINDIKKENPDANRFILSKGHGAMAMYAAHYALGTLTDKDLDSYFSDGSLLHGLCEAKVSACEVSSGSLGHGLPIAVGMAMGKKLLNQQGHIYCLVGDGEMNEGPMWEALLFANHHKLNNLTVIVDANGYQAMGKIDDVLSLEPLNKKFESFGFDSYECDGHNIQSLKEILQKKTNLPKAIVARTVKGKGVSFMENNNEWHYRRLTPELFQNAVSELN